MPVAPTPDRVLKVSRAGARRFLVRRTGLAGRAGELPRWPESACALEAVRTLEYVQVDPMRVLERNHDLVLAARVGGYRPEVLDRLLYEDRRLVEVVARNRCIVPIEDYPLFRGRFAEIEREHRPRLTELEPVMDRILRCIETEGPKSSLDFEDDTRQSGWWDADGEAATRAVRQALEWLWHFGRLAISHRVGGRRYFDLPERVLGPVATAGVGADSPTGDRARPGAARAGAPARATRAGTPARARSRAQARTQSGATARAEAGWRDALASKYFRAMGLIDPRDWGFGWAKYRAPEKWALVERFVAAGELLPVAVEGVPARYFVPAGEADALVAAEDIELSPETRFLPPLDNLVWLRTRLVDVFDFDYTWEAYVPAARRRFGPYTCPILFGDRLVGRVDARVDRKGDGPTTLVVNGLWWEEEAERPPGRVFREALQAWAEFNGATAIDDLSGRL